MIKQLLFLLFLIGLTARLSAQAGHPKDSIMRVVGTCADCTHITWTKQGSGEAIAYRIGTSGVTHRFVFDAANICIRYEEHYPTLGYVRPVSQYMDSAHVKTGDYVWEERLYTNTGILVPNYYVHWQMIISIKQTVEVIAELRKRKN